MVQSASTDFKMTPQQMTEEADEHDTHMIQMCLSFFENRQCAAYSHTFIMYEMQYNCFSFKSLLFMQ